MACRKCDECLALRRRRWVGRLLAEEQTARDVWFVTLTYGGGYDNAEAYLLRYAHVQKWFKRLRAAGHKFKYVAVGEYGGDKSRGHWHVLIYWQTRPPKVRMDENIKFDGWDYGHAYVEKPRSQQGAAVYIMKYLEKDSEAVMRYSKNPMLGREYLEDLARDHARKGVAMFVKGDRFTIPDNYRANGQLWWFPVGKDSAMFDHMLKAYVEEWARVRPHQRMATSPTFDEWFDDLDCDTASFSWSTQLWLERQYDIQAFRPFKSKVETYTLTTGLQIVILAPLARVVVLTEDGAETWRSDLNAGEERVDALTPELLDRAARALREGPNRLRRFTDIQTPQRLASEFRLRKPAPCWKPGAGFRSQGPPQEVMTATQNDSTISRGARRSTDANTTRRSVPRVSPPTPF